MKIHSSATLPPSSLLKANKGRFSLWAYGDLNVMFFYFGRAAIWNAVTCLGMKPGDNILMPSYHCGVEVEAVLKAGVLPKFYEIRENMELDLEDIKEKSDSKTKALFIIHYFGFPQPLQRIKEFCEKNRLYLIEDAAHALLGFYNGRPLGTLGDFGIFSIKKTVPIPDGGALIINNSQFQLVKEIKKPGSKSVIRMIILKLLKHAEIYYNNFYKLAEFCFVIPATFALRIIKKFADSESIGIVSPGSIDFEEDMALLGISEISKKILSNIDFKKVFNQRRKNYSFLLDRLNELNGIRICFNTLSDGVCPLYFPIYVEDRRHFQKILRDRGIKTFVFGGVLHRALPKSGFEISRNLSQHVLALPIHQELEKRHLEYMVEVIRGIVSKKT